ncbi:MAG: type II 3-dehydroquinate dehydratase [Pseudomonadota bacterium]
MPSVLLLQGPNLNLLGTREPELYGSVTCQALEQRVRRCIEAANHQFSAFQSNAEHELIGAIQTAKDTHDFILINPAAYTHTSVAMRDALLAVAIPFIEVHLSNIYQREPFRHHSYFSDIAEGVILGLGPQGYELAAQAAINYFALKNVSAESLSTKNT